MSESATLTTEATPFPLHPEAAVHGPVLEARPVLRKAINP